MIQGVMFKTLVTHEDERGYFREIIRSTDSIFEQGFGQLSHSLVREGVVKAWHGHRVQSQWNYVVSGGIRVVLYDTRPGSETHGRKMEFLASGDNAQLYMFPPGVLHGYRCVTGPMHIIYVTSGTYDPDEEVRVVCTDGTFTVRDSVGP